jgi:hypothetical protein
MRFTIIFALMLSVSLFTGCTNKNPFGTVYVEGMVTLDGVPVSGINVTLNPVGGDGLSGGGITDETGKFMVTSGGAPIDSGAKPGQYNVTFYKVQMEGGELSMEEFQKKYGNRMPPMKHLVPQKYGDPNTSGIAPITVDTDKNKNKFTFELLSK